MRHGDVPDADMPSNPGLQRADVPELPDRGLQALLAGDLTTDEATAGLQPVAPLLAALTAAPEGGELAGHARALAEFRRRAVVNNHARQASSSPWKRPRARITDTQVSAATSSADSGAITLR